MTSPNYFAALFPADGPKSRLPGIPFHNPPSEASHLGQGGIVKALGLIHPGAAFRRRLVMKRLINSFFGISTILIAVALVLQAPFAGAARGFVHRNSRHHQRS